jgi:uncharacterized protein (DUF3820 family)
MESLEEVCKLQVGKHKGKHFEEVDMDYLLWYLYNVKEISTTLKNKIELYIFDNYKLKFGKFKDETIGYVHLNGGNYLEWLYDKLKDDNLKKYVASCIGK